MVEVETETCCVRPNKEGGVGHVLDYSGDGTFNIKYVLDGRVERNIRFGRVKSINPLVLSARRTSTNQLQRPSILSPLHQPQTSDSISPSLTSPAGPQGVAKIIIESRS